VNSYDVAAAAGQQSIIQCKIKLPLKCVFYTEKHSRFATSEQGYINILLEHRCERWGFHLGVPRVQERRNVAIFRQDYTITQPNFGICYVSDATHFNLLTSTFGGYWSRELLNIHSCQPHQ